MIRICERCNKKEHVRNKRNGNSIYCKVCQKTIANRKINKQTTMKIHHAKTIAEAIDNLEQFMIADFWYCVQEEWKTEDIMIKDIQDHFNILRNEIKELEE